MSQPTQKRGAPGHRARQIQSAWAMRALIVGAVLAAVVLLVWVTLKPAPQAPPKTFSVDPRSSQQYTLGVDPKQLETAVKSTRAAFNVFLKRDRVHNNVEAISQEFSRVSSEGDLIQFFKMLAQASGDQYIEVLTNDEYQDQLARLGGARVGIDADVSYEYSPGVVGVGSGYWYKVTRVGPEAARQGLKVGDEVLEIMGMTVPKNSPMGPWQIAQEINNIMQSGLLNSKLEMVVKRGKEEIRLDLVRTVASRVKPFEVTPMLHPLSNEAMPDASVIKFNHLRSQTLHTDLYQALKALQDSGKRGLVVDLQTVGEGNPEIAVRIAAMFLEKGTLAKFIETTPNGELVMKTYEIVNGKVQVKTQGPYSVGSDGNISKTATSPEKVEVKNWPANVFRGHVVAILGRQTSGCGEAIAAAFSHNWREDKSRTQTVAKYYTAGKGTGQTYFPISDQYWLRLSTSFCLQPDGSVIEGPLGPGPDVACPPNQEEGWFARYTLFVRLSVLPNPVWPPEDKPGHH